MVPGLPAVKGSDERRHEKVLDNSEVPVLKTCQTFIIITTGGVAVTTVSIIAAASDDTWWLHSR